MSELLDRLELTPEQQRAFNRMKKAFLDCKKLGVQFEQSHENLIAMNGENVLSVCELEGNYFSENELEIQDCSSQANSFEIGVNPWIDCTVCVSVRQ